MSNFTRKLPTAIAVGWLLLALPLHASINKSVKIPDNAQSDGASSVNGSVTVGAFATVTGDLSSVNGSVRVGDGSRIEDAETVNGSLKIGNGVTSQDLDTVNGKIHIGEDVTVDGGVSAVNGRIELNRGSTVARDLGNVNGDISLRAGLVSGDVSTVNGDVDVVDGTVIKGNLVIEEPGGRGWNNSRKPTIVIGPGSRVEGVIRAEREIKLYISETAEVGGVEGEVSLDDAIRFSGDRP